MIVDLFQGTLKIAVSLLLLLLYVFCIDIKFIVYPYVSLISFLVINLILFLLPQKSNDDTKVKLRNYEGEIRSFLFRKKPELLHTVDKLLDKYAGREKELLLKLQTEYGNKNINKTNQNQIIQSVSPILDQNNFTNDLMNDNNLNYSNSKKTWKAPSATNDNNDNTSTIQKITNLINRHNPSILNAILKSIPAYKNNEDTLLYSLQAEFDDFTDNDNSSVGHHNYDNKKSDYLYYDNNNRFDNGLNSFVPQNDGLRYSNLKQSNHNNYNNNNNNNNINKSDYNNDYSYQLSNNSSSSNNLRKINSSSKNINHNISALSRSPSYKPSSIQPSPTLNHNIQNNSPYNKVNNSPQLKTTSVIDIVEQARIDARRAEQARIEAKWSQKSFK
eukprot:gene9067-12229_t